MDEIINLDELVSEYPRGSSRLENEINSLKRALEVDDEHGADTTSCSKTKKQKTTNAGFTCAECGKNFIQRKLLNRHLTTHSKIKCFYCNMYFSRADARLRHLRVQHGRHLRQEKKSIENSFCCIHCRDTFEDFQKFSKHISKEHSNSGSQTGGRRQQPMTSSSGYKDNARARGNGTSQQSALNGSAKRQVIYPRDGERFDLLLFFANIKARAINYLKRLVSQHRGIKWYFSTQAEMYKESPDGKIQTDLPHFRSLTYSATSVETFGEHEVNEAFQKMNASLESYLKNSSGWHIRKIVQMKIHTVIYSPISGSSYIELPVTLNKSHSVLNIKNDDEKCFLWCILAQLFPAESSPELVRNYKPFERELDMAGIDYPVGLGMIDKFERQNQSISVNVFSFEDREIVPLRITKCAQRLQHVNLLFLKDHQTTHYCLILNLNRFLSRTKSTKTQQFFCPYCLHGFVRQDLLDQHGLYCSTDQPQKIILPEKGKTDILEFKDFQKTERVPFVIYADFETLNLKMEHCQPEPGQSSTTQTTALRPCSFAYKVVSIDESFSKPFVLYRGKNASRKLIECLLKEQAEIENILQNIAPIEMSEEDRKNFREATICVLCHRPFAKSDLKVKHHLHFGRPTGKETNYVGAAHSTCNLACKQTKSFIPIIFHNLKHFDGHIICQSLGLFKQDDIKCIPQTSENYISFSLGKLRFIDSFQFLTSSLETLVEDLKSEGHDAFSYLFKEFRQEHSEMLLRKGVYPYDYMDSEARFDETKLPDIAAFYSEIKREGITESDYRYAQKIFEIFELKSLGDYHDLYLKTDVILLCDVFEHFRSMCLLKYGLDACHFYTSPGLAWTACLKMTGVRLELLTDIDMVNFFQKGTRGGVSQISNRHKVANNPLLGEKHYKESEKTSFIQYLDLNSMYATAMVCPIATGKFRWLEAEEVEQIDLLSIAEDSPVGYVFDVSLGYPQHLHDKHVDLPCAPVKKLIRNEELSPYAKKLWRKLYGKTDSDEFPARACVEKLVTTLEDKDHYVVHYRNLQLYVKLGLEIKAIHRVLQFSQAPWMKPYIEFNTEERKKAKSPFQNNFYKLMNNAVFGKTMENVKKRINFRLVQTEKKLSKLTAKPTFKQFRIFDEELVGVELAHSIVKMDKPIYCGMCILDISKCFIYDWWYLKLKEWYNDKITLCMTDTDSLLFHCETDDIYADMLKNLDLYDTSDNRQDNLRSAKNAKVLGKMKDETSGIPIREFVGLRSKAYSFVVDSAEVKRAKGVSKATVRSDIHFDLYKQTLQDETHVVSTMNTIRSHSHQLFCEKLCKFSLSAFDDKRYLLDSINSLPYGHYKVLK